MRKFYNLILLAVLVVADLSAPAQIANSDKQQLATKVDNVTNKLLEKVPGIPSIVIAIVDENGPFFMRGFGWANKEAGIKADENTLYYIASCTKSFMGLTAALLDHEKKILLDKSFKEYFSNIKFKNEIGSNVTNRTLLTHTSGLENNPLVFRMAFSGAIEKNEILTLLSNATLAKKQFGVFDYDNLGYNIYGLELQEYLNLKWQDLLQEKIFTPLGMNHTTAYISLAEKNKWKMAAPYDAFGEKGLTKIYLAKKDNTMQSAGGIVSTAADLSKWLQAQINTGKVNNKQIFPVNVITTAQTGLANYEKQSYPFTNSGKYALGWNVSNYQNEKIIYHFGGYPGFKAHTSFMPEKKIGLVILTNDAMAGAAASDILAAFIYDRVAGVAGAEEQLAKMVDELETRYKQGVESSQKSFTDRAKRTSQLTLPLNSYVGTYRHELLGDIHVDIENNALAVRFGNLHAVSTPFTQKETIRIELIPGQGKVVAFKVDDQNKINVLTYDNTEYKRVK
ncbi:MAG TPA: serine hydrolase [Chitinophagaceae bacterium]